MKLHDLSMPEVGANEVLIHVEAAGVGVWDPFEREGGVARMFGTMPHFPCVLGSQGAGTATAVGEQVSQFKLGDRVYAAALANPKGGCYAEYTAVATAKPTGSRRQPHLEASGTIVPVP
jgi:NADPH:quinone reductase